MAKKQYLDLAGLTTYDEEIKAYIDAGDASTLTKLTNGTTTVKKAETANTATNATNAVNAEHAETADEATHAASADSATNATNAETADYATNAGTATSATTATTATKANQLTNSQKITLAGDASGSVSFNGAADATLTVTIADDSHNHVISNIDGLQSALDGKASSSHNHDSAYDVKGAAAEALDTANDYTDEQIAALLDGADDATLDSIKELADAIKENDSAIDALNDIASGKANATHTHAISDVTNLQSTLNAKAAASDLTSHTGNTTVHITSTERSNWNTAYNHSQVAHAPADAEANQNAFGKITVGSTTIEADAEVDTLTLVGSNVTITPDATNDKITISVASGSTSAKGIVQLTNSTSSTSTTTAATPSSVKSAYDLANTAKTTAVTAQSAADAAQDTADEAKSAASANTSAISSNTSAISAHTTRITTLEDLVGEGVESIPTASITALFA